MITTMSTLLLLYYIFCQYRQYNLLCGCVFAVLSICRHYAIICIPIARIDLYTYIYNQIKREEKEFFQLLK